MRCFEIDENNGGVRKGSTLNNNMRCFEITRSGIVKKLYNS